MLVLPLTRTSRVPPATPSVSPSSPQVPDPPVCPGAASPGRKVLVIVCGSSELKIHINVGHLVSFSPKPHKVAHWPRCCAPALAGAPSPGHNILVLVLVCRVEEDRKIVAFAHSVESNAKETAARLCVQVCLDHVVVFSAA